MTVPFAARIVNPILYVDVVKLETVILAEMLPCTTILTAEAAPKQLRL